MNQTNTVEEKFDFERYFKDNYEKNIENHLRILRVTDLMLGASFMLMFITLGSILGRSNELSLFSLLALLVTFLIHIILRISSGALIKVSDREIVAYHLFKAADFLKRTEVEDNKKNKKAFVKHSLNHLEKFNALLKLMLRRTKLQMPLSLPDFEHLNKLRTNIMTRIYPRIQERNISEILFSLASIFSLERNYDQLRDINAMLEGTLNPATPFSKETLFNSLTKPVKNNFVVIACVSLVGVIMATFVAIIILRFPIVGIAVDWTYISENSAIIVGGILAAWAALIVVFRPKVEK